MKEPHGHKSRLRVKEQDSDPTVEGVREIRVPNASVTDEGRGIVSLAYDPAGTGDTEAAAHVLAHAGDDDAHHAVFTAAQHTAIGDGAPHHGAVTIGADGEHSLATQVLSGVDAAAAQKGHVQLAGDLGGTAASPTVAATHSGSAHHTKYTDAEAIAAVEAEASLALVADLVTMGVNDTTAGNLSLYGGAGGVQMGGRLLLYVCADYDAGFFESFAIQAYEDDLVISHNTANDLLVKGDRSIEVTTGPLKVDHIGELAAAHGVDIDGVLCKDDAVETDAIRGLRETSGPTSLTVGTITDGEYLKRVGATVVSGVPAGGGSTATDPIWAAAGDLAVATGNDAAGVLTKGTDGKVLTMVAGAVAWAAAGGGGVSDAAFSF